MSVSCVFCAGEQIVVDSPVEGQNETGTSFYYVWASMAGEAE